MDCARLKHDIDELSVLKTQLEARLDSINETGKAKTDDLDSFEQANETQDQILERYLDDFKEQNKDILKWDIEEVGWVPGLIGSITLMQDDAVALVDYDSYVYVLERQEDGNYEINHDYTIELEESFNAKKIHTAPGGSLIVVGEKDVKQCTIKAGGRPSEKLLLSMEGQVSTFEDSAVLGNGDIAIVDSQGGITIVSPDGTQSKPEFPDLTQDGQHFVAAAPNGLLVGMPSGSIQVREKQDDGEYDYYRADYIIPPDEETFEKPACFSNGDIVVTDKSGNVYVCEKRKNDALYDSPRRLGGLNEDEADYRTYNNSTLYPISDKTIAIVSSYSIQDFQDISNSFPCYELRICELLDDGEYRLSPAMLSQGNALGEVLQLSDGGMLTCKWHNAGLCAIRQADIDLSGLKEHLKAIARKAPTSESELSAL